MVQVQGGGDWCHLNTDLVRLVATSLLSAEAADCDAEASGEAEAGSGRRGRQRAFNSVLAMTHVCSAWRASLLDAPLQGMEGVEFSLPKELVRSFRFCSLGSNAGLFGGFLAGMPPQVYARSGMPLAQMRLRKLGQLPRLVSRWAHWGNAHAALVVAIVSTESCLGRTNAEALSGGGPRGKPVTSQEDNALMWQKYQAMGPPSRQDPSAASSGPLASFSKYGEHAMALDLIQLWKRGARLGSKCCQAVLGEAFYCGGGVELSKVPCVQDIEQAILWLSRAADHGEKVTGRDPMVARSELLLGYIFQDGQESWGETSYADYMLYGRNDRGMQEAVFWFKRAASHGSVEAQESLRSLYSTGQY